MGTEKMKSTGCSIGDKLMEPTPDNPTDQTEGSTGRIAAEAAGNIYDENEFFADLGFRETFVKAITPHIQTAINSYVTQPR